MTRDVRVCLIGDEGVGKSSIISALIKESFVKIAPKTTLPEVTIPPSVTPGHDVTTNIVDTSSRPEDKSHLVNEIRKAHVVGIVYAIDNPSSFDRVPTYWLQMIRYLGVNVPVILIGNKIDLRQGDVSNDGLMNEVKPIMKEYKEVETCVECSAKLPLNISEVFYFAQNAVLHPTAPLYDSREHTLKPACIQALTRIFKLCDVNKDDLLDDEELNDFQRMCFNGSLQTREIEGIKEIISAKEEKGVRNGGITLKGFLFLHTHFIQHGRLETTWKALRVFGYGEDLSLRDDFLRPRFDVPSDCTVELSSKGYQFFTDIFEIFDKDNDGALSTEELNNLLSTTPGNPWKAYGFPESTITSDGAVTLQGWLAQWSMTTLLEPKTTLAYLAYLGYPHSFFSAQRLSSTHPTHTNTSATAGDAHHASQVSSAASSIASFLSSLTSASSAGTSSQNENYIIPTTSALTITEPKKLTRRRVNETTPRNVFLAYVLGAAGSGKTTMLRAFVGKNTDEKTSPTMKVNTVVNAVESGGNEKYLVLQEFGSTYESEMLRQHKNLAIADVLVFVYDSSDTNSFSYISNLRQQYKLDNIPSIFVATKSDLDLAQQRHEVQPDTYCHKLKLPVPVAVSFKTGQTADLFHTITKIALRPLSAIPGGPDRQAISRLGYYFYGAVFVGGASAVFFVLWRSLARSNSTAGPLFWWLR